MKWITSTKALDWVQKHLVANKIRSVEERLRKLSDGESHPGFFEFWSIQATVSQTQLSKIP